MQSESNRDHARSTIASRRERPPVIGALAGFVMCLGGQAAGQEPADKRVYNLFNPTPRQLMRPLSADRPDATESPVTVDAGHVQIETSFFSYTVDDEDHGRAESWALLDTNMKVGVLNNVDLQFVFAAHGEERTEGPGPDEAERGFSDLQVRTKINLWGNDRPGPGDTALGIMPFVTIPTGGELSTDHVEGGIITMLGWDAGETWGLGFQLEAGWVYDDADDAYDTQVSHTAVLGFDVLGPLAAYVEYLGAWSTDGGSDYLPIFSGGLTYAVTEDLVLDVGTQVGLNDDAEDLTLFTGATIRF